MIPDPKLTLACPAKINLALSVGGPRPGDGYHPICSWMTQVSLADELTLEPTIAAASFDIGWADDAPVKSPIDWPVEKDLIFKAHQLVQQQAGRLLPVRAVLRKRTPVGAGMGGGSSDAAGMLRGLDALFDLNLPREVLVGLASKLGSDVAFFLGEPSGIISGVGERLEPAPLREPIHIALILPELHCNTRAVYLKFDQVSTAAAVDEPSVRRLAANWPDTAHELFNDLAMAAFCVAPRLRELHAKCENATRRRVHVTGSGAAMFIVCRDAGDASAVCGNLRADVGVTTLAAHTL